MYIFRLFEGARKNKRDMIQSQKKKKIQSQDVCSQENLLLEIKNG